jgi:PPOX class probable F420-dependent enzyme
MAHELDKARYVSFTSYKQNGTAVSLPVWIVDFEGGWAFTTDPGAFKLKRILRNPRVTLQACGVRGKVAEGSREYTGTAEYLDSATADRVNKAIRRKYWIAYRLLISPANLWARLRGRAGEAGHAAIKIVLD